VTKRTRELKKKRVITNVISEKGLIARRRRYMTKKGG
jgi:hypothetical protein